MILGKRIGAVLLVSLLILVLVETGSALSVVDHNYAGNTRIPGYGVKANIQTPQRKPNVAHGVIFNYVTNIDATQPGYLRWIQTGWVQGDGVVQSPDLQTYPSNPWSYEEANLGPYWTHYVFAKIGTAQQPLNFTRSYEVVANTINNPSFWTVYIAGAPRDQFYPYKTPTDVAAKSEIVKIDNWPWPEDWATFTGIKYKGQFTYYPFDQNNREADMPPWRVPENSNDSYTCSNPQNY